MEGTSNILCTALAAHKFLSDKFHFAFSLAYYIYPQTSNLIHLDGTHIIPYVEEDFGGKEQHNQWFCPDIEKPTDQSSDSNPKPTAQVISSDDTKTPDSSVSTTPSK